MNIIHQQKWLHDQDIWLLGVADRLMKFASGDFNHGLGQMWAYQKMGYTQTMQSSLQVHLFQTNPYLFIDVRGSHAFATRVMSAWPIRKNRFDHWSMIINACQWSTTRNTTWMEDWGLRLCPSICPVGHRLRIAFLVVKTPSLQAIDTGNWGSSSHLCQKSTAGDQQKNMLKTSVILIM